MNISLDLDETEIQALKEFRVRHEFLQALPSQSLKSVTAGVDTLLLKASEAALSHAEIDQIRAEAKSRAERIVIST